MSAPADLRGWLGAFVREAHFLARYPYYAHVLAALSPVADPSVPLMGVSLHAAPGSRARYYLHVHVEEIARMPQFLRGILLHEVHHVVLGHLAHPKFYGAAQPDLMQIAQETSANEHIDEPLPSPVLWQHFERFGLRAGQSTLQRYRLLCEARAEGAQPALARDTQLVDEHAWVSADRPPPGGLTETRQILEQVEQAGADDAAKVEAERGKLAGHTPAQLLAQLGGTSGPPEVVVDWRDALRAFVSEARAPLHTWSRPSRRFPSRVGQVPGRAYRVRPVLRPRLIIAIDTSLSMSEAELAEIARQLSPLGELAQLHVVECDRSIARSYAFTGTIDRVKGRGGTDLRPVFEPAFLCARGADGVVYFTDGDGPYPDLPPPIPVLWMLTKPRDFACPWGARAALRLAATDRARR
ncbi:MAG: VWA-like domain-containing protein [Polyangiales bacterium]